MKHRNIGDRVLFISVNLILLALIFAGLINAVVDNSSSGYAITSSQIVNQTNSPTPSPTNSNQTPVNSVSPTITPQPSPSPSATAIVNNEYLFIDEDLLYSENMEKLFDAMVNYEATIEIDDVEMDGVEKTIADCLDILYGTQYSNVIESYTYSQNGNNVIVNFKYRDRVVSDIDEVNKEIDRISKTLFDTSMNDLDKIKAAHDYLVLNVAYDDATYQDYIKGNYNPNSRAFSAYGALVEGYAVCQGYSYAYNMLLNYAGIETRYISSDALNHGWSMVELEDAWYHVDATHDDPNPDMENFIQYQYLLKNDEYMKGIDANRIISTSPQAIENSYNYQIYDFKIYSLNNIGYFYHLEDDTLYRYLNENDSVDLSSKEMIVEDVSSWISVDNEYLILYTQKSDGDIYSIDLDGFYKQKILDADDTLIIGLDNRWDRYVLSCINDLNDEPLELVIDK